jgi:MSHA pilin protein MshA
MQKNIQAGFTLIELVVVIVILGILAATALPKFIDLSAEANTAALQGIGGAVSSASSINYASRLANPTKAGTIAVATCDAAGALVVPAVPSSELSTTATPAGAATDCVLTRGTTSVTFPVIGSL